MILCVLVIYALISLRGLHLFMDIGKNINRHGKSTKIIFNLPKSRFPRYPELDFCFVFCGLSSDGHDTFSPSAVPNAMFHFVNFNF
jgi:hypothetical protein